MDITAIPEHGDPISCQIKDPMEATVNDLKAAIAEQLHYDVETSNIALQWQQEELSNGDQSLADAGIGAEAHVHYKTIERIRLVYAFETYKRATADVLGFSSAQINKPMKYQCGCSVNFHDTNVNFIVDFQALPEATVNDLIQAVSLEWSTYYNGQLRQETISIKQQLKEHMMHHCYSKDLTYKFDIKEEDKLEDVALFAKTQNDQELRWIQFREKPSSDAVVGLGSSDEDSDSGGNQAAVAMEIPHMPTVDAPRIVPRVDAVGKDIQGPTKITEEKEASENDLHITVNDIYGNNHIVGFKIPNEEANTSLTIGDFIMKIISKKDELKIRLPDREKYMQLNILSGDRPRNWRQCVIEKQRRRTNHFFPLQITIVDFLQEKMTQKLAIRKQIQSQIAQEMRRRMRRRRRRRRRRRAL